MMDVPFIRILIVDDIIHTLLVQMTYDLTGGEQCSQRLGATREVCHQPRTHQEP